MGNQYCVVAGSRTRPETMEYGRLEKKMGQTQTIGSIVKGIAPRGDVMVPNYTEFWGARLDLNGKIPESPLDIKSLSYRGVVKELPWGDPKGCLIIGRYLKGFQSIDQQYQDVVLQVKLREEDDVYFLRMQTGDNYYDVESDKFLAQMVRVHYLNASSKSKSPDSTKSFFADESDETSITAETKVISKKFEALSVVMEASQDNSGEKLKNLYAVLLPVVEAGIKDNDLYKYFSLMADQNPETFMDRIDAYNLETSDAFSKAESFKMIDTSRDGFILLGEENKTKDIIAEGVPGKGSKMLDWVMKNYMDKKAFDITYKVKQFTDKIK